MNSICDPTPRARERGRGGGKGNWRLRSGDATLLYVCRRMAFAIVMQKSVRDFYTNRYGARNARAARMIAASEKNTWRLTRRTMISRRKTYLTVLFTVIAPKLRLVCVAHNDISSVRHQRRATSRGDNCSSSRPPLPSPPSPALRVMDSFIPRHLFLERERESDKHEIPRVRNELATYLINDAAST